jgi:low affinity Fe/Cu permease
MIHTIFCDGNAKRICWSIQSGQNIVDQFREQAKIYVGQVSDTQATYIALHVGIFWGIGVFIIKNGDTIRIQLESEEMIRHLASDQISDNKLIEDKKKFINMLAAQRALVYQYEKIEHAQNISSKML